MMLFALVEPEEGDDHSMFVDGLLITAASLSDARIMKDDNARFALREASTRTALVLGRG